MKSLPEDLLEVVWLGELEENAGCSFGKAETAPKVEFVANTGRLVQA